MNIETLVASGIVSYVIGILVSVRIFKFLYEEPARIIEKGNWGARKPSESFARQTVLFLGTGVAVCIGTVLTILMVMIQFIGGFL